MRKRKQAEAAEQANAEALERIRFREMLGVKAPGTKVKRKVSHSVSVKEAETFTREVELMIESGDVSGMQPRHFTALFCWIHEAIYEVKCDDEVRQEWRVCSARVAAMLKEQFGGDVQAMYDYVTWLAKREEGRVEWRKANARENTFRLQWRHVFLQLRNLTDYRLMLAQKEGVQ